ncbi:MAG: hypothetical protein WC679_09520 [Bacteroidales bacterium]|jgi:hypothetical protein
MKKIFLLFIPLLSTFLFSSCEFDLNNDNVYDFDSKISELQDYKGSDIFDVVDHLKEEGLYVESNDNGVITMTDNNGSVVYILYPYNNNKIAEVRFEYYTDSPTTALDYYGNWHNRAFDLGYSNFYYGEITYLNYHKDNYNDEYDFINNFENYGADIYNCYEEWNSNYNGCRIEYQVLSISRRVISVNCYYLDKKKLLLSNKK